MPIKNGLVSVFGIVLLNALFSISAQAGEYCNKIIGNSSGYCCKVSAELMDRDLKTAKYSAIQLNKDDEAVITIGNDRNTPPTVSKLFLQRYSQSTRETVLFTLQNSLLEESDLVGRLSKRDFAATNLRLVWLSTKYKDASKIQVDYMDFTLFENNNGSGVPLADLRCNYEYRYSGGGY